MKKGREFLKDTIRGETDFSRTDQSRGGPAALRGEALPRREGTGQTPPSRTMGRPCLVSRLQNDQQGGEDVTDPGQKLSNETPRVRVPTGQGDPTTRKRVLRRGG